MPLRSIHCKQRAMKILKVLTLRGPNYWSITYKKLIVMRVDLEDYADRPTNTIRGFHEGLVEILPSLVEHRCSRGYRGGFLERVKEGTYLGHVIEHVALELQDLAGMHVGFGRARQTGTQGIYQVVFEYQDAQAGRYAGRAAVRLCQSLVETGRYPQNEIEQDLKDLKEIREEAALGPSTETIVRKADALRIPWFPLSTRSMIQLGYGVNQKRIQATLTSQTGILGVELACDKEGTKRILYEAGVPVPMGTVIRYFDELEDAIDEVGGFPIAIKPLDGNHGRGISLDVSTFAEAEAAYDLASEESKTQSVIVERFYKGKDHRVLVVNGKVVAVAERIPAHVEGDGRSTIAELIEETNRDPQRGEGHANVLTKITVDRKATDLLDKQGYTLESVPEKGDICYLRATANLSTGGIAVDRTDVIHPENVWIAQRAVKILGLDIAGLDVVTSDISKPLRENDGVIVEVNAAPGFRMHFSPSRGQPRDVGGAALAALFPTPEAARIPILAVTGTNGKTTTTRLLAHIIKQTERVVGYTTTDGTYIGDYLVEAGDNTGPQSAELILKDPTVEVAVLETARGGILRSGMAFDAPDVGVVLNVSADHLGLGDIDTVEQMARLKAVVVEAVREDGYAVLNADDPLVAGMAERLRGKIAYFSMDPNNPIVRSHMDVGGIAAVYYNGELQIWEAWNQTSIEKAENVPLTMGGKAPFMIANALAACLAAYLHGVSIENMQAALPTFRASTEQTPGRMNLFDLGTFHALVDYAHNPAGYEAVGGFVRNWEGKRVGVVGAPGDRRDEDFIELGKLCAKIFDRIIVKEDDDNRGRERGAVAELICKGIRQSKPDADYETILEEAKAIDCALDTAPPGSLVVFLPESVTRAIQIVKKRQPAGN